jgi:hypothetical protein
METILAQQRDEVANLIVTEKSVGIPRREHFVSDNDRVRRVRSEAVSSASPNRCLSEHDAWRRIT